MIKTRNQSLILMSPSPRMSMLADGSRAESSSGSKKADGRIDASLLRVLVLFQKPGLSRVCISHSTLMERTCHCFLQWKPFGFHAGQHFQCSQFLQTSQDVFPTQTNSESTHFLCCVRLGGAAKKIVRFVTCRNTCKARAFVSRMFHWFKQCMTCPQTTQRNHF